ncbi:MAG: tetratricopeptide repeat protein [Paracoccaceae bacterium]
MSVSTALKGLLLGGIILALGACRDDAERAEAHYQKALELIEEGDTVRASIEFRNVFQRDGAHLEARATYAAMLREIGDTEQSYRQYLRLVEQDPGHVEGRIALAEMALSFQNWEEARWHGTRVLERAPDAPEAGVIALNLDYLAAIEAEEIGARQAVAQRTRALLESDPDNLLLQRLVIDSLIRDFDFEDALDVIDASLATNPDSKLLHDTRLQVLAALERYEAFEAQLQDMLVRFPEDEELQWVLLRFYLSRDDTASAQSYLTNLSDTADKPETREQALLALVRLLMAREGPQAAMAELDRIIEAQEGDTAPYRALRASAQFESGDRAAGIKEIESLLSEDLSLIDRGRYQMVLAQMLLQDGDTAAAQGLVDAVLGADPNQTDALKMRAVWLIEEDDTQSAIRNLRTVLDETPEDIVALTLIASAHARAGNRELSREFLSLAAQASGSAPAETQRYARALIEDERYLLAEEALIAALRLDRSDIDLLSLLGLVHLRMSDWAQAENVERRLREIGTEEAVAQANRLHAALLAQRGNTEEVINFLKGLASLAGDSDVGAQAAVIQAHLESGDVDGALALAEKISSDNPDNLSYVLVLASVQAGAGQLDPAEANFRRVLEARPEALEGWVGLIRVLDAQNQEEAVQSALKDAQTALPESLDLLWIQAGFLEEAGDFEGAIALYEQLYEQENDSLVVANNLASLISTYRTSDEDLNRAYEIARRLRGSDFAPFQDTYGWIAYRRGQYDDALDHLEPAVQGLPDNALVHYHLGMTYLALERSSDALERLRQAVELAGPEDDRAQFVQAREQIEALEAKAAE